MTWVLTLGGELDLLLNVDGFNEVGLDGVENAARGVFPAYPRAWALRVDDFSDPERARRLALARDRSSLDDPRQSGPPQQTVSAERMKILVDVWQRSSIELARLAAAHGISYLQFLQPNQYDDGAKVMGPDERRLAFRDDHPYRPGARAGYPLLRRAGQTLRIEGDFFHDFSRLFENVTAPLFGDDCCHLNRDGYNRVADAIADVVATRIQVISRP